MEKNFWKIYRRVNGTQILKQYAHSGVLGFALLETLLLGFSQKSLELVRLAVENKILGKLRKKYKKVIQEYLDKENRKEPGVRKRSEKVWVCWLQGFEAAPEIVKVCHASIKYYLKDREIIDITQDNYTQYVSFPSYMEKKIADGVITSTHFSDLLRLALLLKYGGTWIDATVLCTSAEIPDYMLNSNLFLFQCLKPGRDGHPSVISSWFITACSNHPILRLTQFLLYRYWKEKNVMCDYFLFHDLFQLATEAYPLEWERVVQRCNAEPHILLLSLFEAYQEDRFKNILEMSCFHKLSYKCYPEQPDAAGTNYEYLIKKARALAEGTV